jgi:hypothetical protein
MPLTAERTRVSSVVFFHFTEHPQDKIFARLALLNSYKYL